MDFSYEKDSLLRKISSKSSAEDIQKWREQRKMLYLSKQNLDLKEKRDQVLFERGERVTEFKQKFQRNKRPTWKSRRQYADEDKINGKINEKIVGTQPQTEITVEAKPSNVEKSGVEMVETNIKEPATSNGLALLLNSYSACSDSEPEEGEIVDDKPKKLNSPGAKMKKTGKRRRKAVDESRQTSRTVDLLRRLLSSEIQHERNMILQCVCFVVQNQFFNSPNESALTD